jgi:hypothetical protein
MIVGECVLVKAFGSDVCVELEEMAFKAMLDNNMQAMIDSTAQ